jgi:hypothetical protein
MRIAFGHPAVLVAVAAALAGLAGMLAFASPAYRRAVQNPPRDRGLPYARARYGAADAKRVFAAAGVSLTRRSSSAAVTTLGDGRDVLEVDVFADPKAVEASGFHDDALVPPGRHVRFPRSCGGPVPDAERRRGNVRVLVSCRAAGGGADAWLRRVERALARL